MYGVLLDAVLVYFWILANAALDLTTAVQPPGHEPLNSNHQTLMLLSKSYIGVI